MSMQAAVLDRLGPDARFRFAELPVPEPGHGEVRIRVQAVGVNPADVATRSGWVPLDPAPRFPLVLGWDLAGVVDAHGAGVTGPAIGEAVVGFSAQLTTRVGTYAEYVTLDRADVAPAPAGWSALDAATLPSSGLTALQALDAAAVAADDLAVVTGAAGTVGALVTALAVGRGAHVVAVVGGADRDRARAAGARVVVDRDDDVGARVRDQAPGGVDVGLSAARDSGPVALAVVRDGGRFATVADHPAPPPERGIDPREVIVASDGDRLHELTRLAERGVITSRRSLTLPFTQVDDAHERITRGGLAGKVVLDLS